MQTNSPAPRRGYASADADRRIRKARKIQALLSGVCQIDGARVLEIGTGAGYIAAHFADQVGPAGRVHAVDVNDTRKIQRGYYFQRVDDTTLPFPDATFDICISNHVIEHVGNTHDQQHHLREIRRVLRPRGWLYLAVPNRYTLIEPHFRLPFLSWLPQSLSDRYVRAAGKGDRYDCAPPSRIQLQGLLREAGLTFEHITIDGIRQVAELETRPGILQQLLRRPELWAWLVFRILPTYLFLAQPSAPPEPSS